MTNTPVIAAAVASAAALLSTTAMLLAARLAIRSPPPGVTPAPVAATGPDGAVATAAAAPAPQRRGRGKKPPTPVFSGTNDIESTLPPEVAAMHEQAVASGELTYTDPETGFTVFTRVSHLQRGRCCGSRCRHCPYNHINVPGNRETALRQIQQSEAAGPPEAARAAASAPSAHSVVYTKTGDKGTSTLFTGERRKKTDAVFEALGAVDELSSHVGLARAMMQAAAAGAAGDTALMAALEAIQQELLNAGTVIATPAAEQLRDKGAEHSIVRLLEGYRFPTKTAEMESGIDAMDARLEPLRIFILPGGGNVASAQLHVCRTTCRRAERRMIEVREVHGDQYTDHLRQAIVYVNRLSDFFFVAARSVAEEDIVRKYD